MRKSSRGNPYHDERGRFCSGPKSGKPYIVSERTPEEYAQRTIERSVKSTNKQLWLQERHDAREDIKSIDKQLWLREHDAIEDSYISREGLEVKVYYLSDYDGEPMSFCIETLEDGTSLIRSMEDNGVCERFSSLEDAMERIDSTKYY